MPREFKIKVKEFNLGLTMYSGQTSQPPWPKTKDGYTELVIVDEKPCLLTIKQVDNKLHIKSESNEKIPLSAVKDKVDYIFDLRFDIEDFYDFLYSHPLLKPTVNYSRGLRLFLAKDIFECVISSITSANNSIKGWTIAIENMKRLLGEAHHFSRGYFYAFPHPGVLANCRPEDLRPCGVGYRDKYIIGASRMILDQPLEDMMDMGYEDAFNLLLKLPGVGPKVADCILLYGLRKLEAFPVDVWIKRIMGHIYQEFNDRRLRELVWEEFGDYAGYVQLYLYNYARNTLK